MEHILLTLLAHSNISTNATGIRSLIRLYNSSLESVAAVAADGNDLNSAYTQHVSDIVQSIARITTPAIIVTGCLGNLLAVLVFRFTTLCKQSSSYYLAALCISDTGFLVLNAIEYLSTHQYINIYHQPIACETLNYLSGVFSFLSVWFVVAFTAERYVAVLHPLRRPDWCTVRRAKLMLAVCTLLGMVLNTPLLYFSDLVPNDQWNRTVCELFEHKKVLFKFQCACVAVRAACRMQICLLCINWQSAHSLPNKTHARRS